MSANFNSLLSNLYMKSFFECIVLAGILALLTVSCSSVGKHEPFLKFKDSATVLKTQTENAFALTGLDLTNQLKTENLNLARNAAKQFEALESANAERTAAEASLKTAEESLAVAEAAGNSTMEQLAALKAAISSAKEVIQKAHEKAKKSSTQYSVLSKELKKRLGKLDIKVTATAKEPFKWGTPEMPSFLEIKRMKAEVMRGAGLFEEYADLLSQLSNPALIDDARFQKTADNLNESARELFVNQLRISKPQSVAIISSASISAAKVYLKNKQSKQLQKALSANQKTVEAYTQLIQEAITLLKKNINKYYDGEMNLSTSLLQDVKTYGLDAEEERAKSMGRIITLNDNYSTLMENLQSLSDSYRKISESHAMLSNLIISPSLSLAYIDYAGGEAAAMATQAQRSVAINRYREAALVAERTDAVAKEYEKQAVAAELETNLAKAEYDISKAISDANPQDKAAKEKAEKLNEMHFRLKVVSDSLKAKAAYYRGLAKADKVNTDALKPAADAQPASKDQPRE